MADDIDSLELDCGVCGTNLEMMGLSPVQLEHMMDLWKRDHTHTPKEMRAWYRASADGVRNEQED